MRNVHFKLVYFPGILKSLKNSRTLWDTEHICIQCNVLTEKWLRSHFQGSCQEHMCQPLTLMAKERNLPISDLLKCWHRLLKTHTCGLICFKLLYCEVCHIMELKSSQTLFLDCIKLDLPSQWMHVPHGYLFLYAAQPQVVMT